LEIWDGFLDVLLSNKEDAVDTRVAVTYTRFAGGILSLLDHLLVKILFSTNYNQLEPLRSDDDGTVCRLRSMHAGTKW
jgi:hypothetical protein